MERSWHPVADVDAVSQSGELVITRDELDAVAATEPTVAATH